MSANHFVLRHHDVEVEYTVGVTPGIPALTYCDGSSPKKSFTGAEVATDETALGTVVSVPLLQTIDTPVGSGSGSCCRSSTSRRGNRGTSTRWGCTRSSPGPTRSPQAAPSWRGIELHGTAQTVIVPL
jgi:hypothetical protein